MATRRKRRGSQLLKRVRRIIKREGLAFLTLLSMVAGAAAFFAISNETWIFKAIDWSWLIIIIASLIHLPKAFDKLKNGQESYIIFFALGFREGFLAPALIAPNLSTWIGKMRGLWRNFKRK